ncbi:hypothetical protein J1605_018333 [Eschrichtius robustus]|uniref:Uncharacterized protein n=1 Tax=Eschrichtius robustus TaxID=9764 RepID=A0AB34HT01_ESCRO|nr:hypothetical protein J1605_018333 [Eschrichtius robustus]
MHSLDFRKRSPSCAATLLARPNLQILPERMEPQVSAPLGTKIKWRLLPPCFAFLRSTWTGTGTCAGTGGPRLGRRHLPRVPRAEDGPRAMGDAPWELVSRDGGDGTFLVPKWFR